LRGIRKTAPQVVKLKKDLRELTNDLGNMEALKRNAAEAQENILSKTKKIISEEQLTSLLNDLSELANKNNVQILEMRPTKESGSKLEKPSQTAKFSPLLVKLELVSDYHNLGKFINTLENNPTFIAVQDMNIISRDSDFLKQKVVLILRTYVRK
jgi:Tfp pilus assembly protein PilO